MTKLRTSAVRAQQKLRDEYCEAYGFTRDQIGFDGASLDPIFDFDALSVLANMLADIPAINVGLEKFDEAKQMAESFCEITLHGNRTRKIFGVAIIGEVLHDLTKLDTMRKAIEVSRSRALRVGLRAVGFDPVKAHEQRKQGKVVDLLGEAAALRDRRVAEIHVIAGPQGLNYITRKGDRTEYERLLATYFDGRCTSKDLKDQEVSEWLGILRGFARGIKRAAA
jgi:hypothetical protein